MKKITITLTDEAEAFFNEIMYSLPKDLETGEVLCNYLEIDFDEVYARTNTSYKPMKHKIKVRSEKVTIPGVSKPALREDWEERWYSDYKSASSVL